MPFTVEGRPPVTIDQAFDADFRRVNQHYLSTLRIPLLRGRNFTEQEVRQSAKVLLISELLASQVFPNEDPLGKRLIMVMGPQPWEIIGIVGDIRDRALETQPFPAMYMPTYASGRINLVIRTQGDPTSITAAVRKEVHALDPDQPVADVKTMEQWVETAVAGPRYRTLLLGLFALLALVLAPLESTADVVFSGPRPTKSVYHGVGADNSMSEAGVSGHGLVAGRVSGCWAQWH